MMYFSDTLEEESRGFQTFSQSVFIFTNPMQAATRALPSLEPRGDSAPPPPKKAGTEGREPRLERSPAGGGAKGAGPEGAGPEGAGPEGAGPEGGGATWPLWKRGGPRKRNRAPSRYGAGAVQSAAGGGGDFPSGSPVSASSSHSACSAAEAAVAAAAVPTSPPSPPRPVPRPAALAGRGNSSCRRPPLPQRR